MNNESVSPLPPSAGKALLAGGLAALFASACCLGPLVLVLVGISGAWIGNLAALQPYQPLFMGASLVALFFAWRRIWRPVECTPGLACAVPRIRLVYKALFGLVVFLLIAALAVPLIAPWFY